MGKKSKRIIIFSEVYHPSIGGIERMTDILATGLRTAGHEISIITASASNPKIETQRPWPILRNPSIWERLQMSFAADVVFHNHISLKNGWPGFLPFWKTQFWLHTNLGPKLVPRLVKQFVLYTSRVACVSNDQRLRIWRRAKVINNGIDFQIFNSAKRPAKNDYDVMFAGRIIEGKGIFLLLDALSKIKTAARVAIAGSGPAMDEALIRARTLEAATVEFLGPQPPSEIALLMSRSKVLVVPSTTHVESLSLVPIEGIAAGCRVIATDNGGNRESVGSCGIIVPQNPEALAEAIDKAITSNEWCSAETISEHLNKFTIDKMMENWRSELSL